MIKFVTFLAFAISQVLSGAVEVLPAAAVAPVVAPAVVTSRSSQYFTQNHNALAAPLVAPVAPVVEAVAPVPARIEAVAPTAARVQAPLAQYIAPSSSSFSQVIRYGQYVAPAPYFAAPYLSAPLVQAPFVAGAAPLVAKSVVAPLVARGPVAVPVAQPIAPAQPVATPQQPHLNPVVPAPNPDAESVDIESARLRALPQTINEPAEQQRQQLQQSFARLQQQLRAQQNQRSAQSQQTQQETRASARNQAQPQQQSAAPGFLSQEQFIQGPY
ncbi:unnamed protein product [Ceutorhynchus assimilis]|uniref:Uncharacterized protein n=1 Tax=Ceutorhynchus assimilis TaxID=467358 RepID=A0A9N9MY53_9CUCU|nr:unnamed protein product [Ceutorhynchus assimilis]